MNIIEAAKALGPRVYLRRKNWLGTAIFLALLAGCDVESIKTSRVASGELRQKLFAQCMGLAAENTRVLNDDVSDLVDACNSYAYYTAQQSTP